MSTTGPYQLGATSNGFPYCPRKIDLTDLEDVDGNSTTADWWITLGGTQKGNAPTASAIHLSWLNAIKLTYETYSVTGTARSTEYGFGEFPVEIDEEEVRIGLEEYTALDFPELDPEGSPGSTDYEDNKPTMLPNERECMRVLQRKDGAGTPYQLKFRRDPGSGFPRWQRGYGRKAKAYFYGAAYIYSAAVIVQVPEIVRMYNGDISDEGNFVGYGVASFFNGNASEDTGTPKSVLREFSDNAYQYDGLEGDMQQAEAHDDFGDRGSWLCNGPFQAAGRANQGSSEIDVKKHVFVSWIPDEDYFPLGVWSNTTRSITYSTFGGIPFVEVNYDSYNDDDWADAELTALTFYTQE